MQRIHIELKDDDISAVEMADLASKIEVLLRISRFRWQVSLPDTEFSMGSEEDLAAFKRWTGDHRGRDKDR